MDADFIDVTKSGNKIAPILFFLIIIAFGILGYFFVFKKTYFSLKKIEVELGSTLSTNILDYVNGDSINPNDYKLDVSNIDTNTVGNYTYSITYKDKTKTSKIEVVDTTAPEFTLAPLTVEANDENFFLGNILTSCTDLSKPCLVTFKDSSDETKIKTPGNYNINVYISDIYGNKKETTANIIVVEEGTLVDPKAEDLKYFSASVELETFNDEYFLKLDKGLDKDSEEAGDQMTKVSTTDWETYIKENYPEYIFKDAELIEIYNQHDYLIGIAVRLTITINGTEKQIFATKPYNLKETEE